MNNKKYFVFLSMSSFYYFLSPACSQQLEVKNLSFKSDGNVVTIKYDLEGMVNKKYKTYIRLSNDSGKTFTVRPKTISGDIGKNIYPGINKKITWNFSKDFPDGLEGENYVFAVDAELQKRSLLPYFAVGVPIIGGAVYYLINGSEKDPQTKGSISISVSGDF